MSSFELPGTLVGGDVDADFLCLCVLKLAGQPAIGYGQVAKGLSRSQCQRIRRPPLALERSVASFSGIATQILSAPVPGAANLRVTRGPPRALSRPPPGPAMPNLNGETVSYVVIHATPARILSCVCTQLPGQSHSRAKTH